MSSHPLQDPKAFKEARHALGLSAQGLAKALHLGADGGRAVRRWESGERSIPGPAAVALALWRDPACPQILRPPRSPRSSAEDDGDDA